MAGPGVGDPAPRFELPGTGGRRYSLDEYRGGPVVVAFYPGDDTPVCTLQLRSYSGQLETFEGLGATLLAISPQGVESHERFMCRNGLRMPLLADEDKEVGRAYGVLGPLGFYRRSVFVVDGEGTIRYAHRAMAGMTYRSAGELAEVIKGLA